MNIKEYGFKDSFTNEYQENKIVARILATHKDRYEIVCDKGQGFAQIKRGFYYDNPDDNIGDLDGGLEIKNKQLYKLDYAPICRECDAWHCKRCIWLNRSMTLEVNTPSHEQCVMAHLERNTSRDMLTHIRNQSTFLPENPDIPELDYTDPFDKIINK